MEVCLSYDRNSGNVTIGDLTLHFSYNTCVAFSTPKTGLVVRQNGWGPTTGKHLNEIDGGGKAAERRLPGTEFQARLQDVLSVLHVG